MGQQWEISAEGGYFAVPKLSQKLREAAQPMLKFRPFARVEPGFGKKKGDTLYFDKLSNVQTRGGKFSETQKIPETKFLITQGSLVMDQYGNSIPFTGKLEYLSEFDIQKPIHRALRDDMAKVMDIAVATEMKTTQMKYIATGDASGTWDGDGTASTAATANMSLYHVKEIIDALKTGEFGSSYAYRPVPPYDADGNYVCVLSVRAARGIKDDPEWEDLSKYAQPKQALAGEIGRAYGCRFIESNHTDALDNAIGTSNVTGEALFFGSDPVIEGVAVPEEIRIKVRENYGLDGGVAWYFLGGWELPWVGTTDNEVHVVHYTSS